VKIRYIFETHRNEDYVIGSIELSSLIGAKIFHGPGQDWKYGNTLHNGEIFHIGSLMLTALHTPGHTDEGMSYVLSDLLSGDKPVMVLVQVCD
jgi:hydroxyacylglutathione hydrolase